MGVLLLIIATILKMVFGGVGYAYGTVRSFIKGGYKEWDEWNKDLALCKDQYGNVVLKYCLNDWATKSNGYNFGYPDETISSVLGKNKINNTSTSFGIILSKTLNYLDHNHVEKSIDDTISNK